MVSRLILFVHTLVFSALMLGSLASPFINAAYPLEFSAYYPWGVGALLLIILGSWFLYGGDCPLTVWENRARKREGRLAYRGSCLVYYARRWFGMRLSSMASNIIPVGVLLIPLVVGFFF